MYLCYMYLCYNLYFVLPLYIVHRDANHRFVGTTMERPTITARRSIIADYNEPECKTHYNDAQPALNLRKSE